MRKVYEYSHLGGSEILQCRFPEINREIDDIISSVIIVEPSKVSKEKTRAGKMLYSPTLMNSLFRQQFYARGFKEL